MAFMRKGVFMMATSAMILSSLSLMSGGLFVGATFAQENMTTTGTPTNETGAMMGNQTNQTGGNETQGPLEQLGEALGGVFGGNQSQ
jgi:hypothetical protein